MIRFVLALTVLVQLTSAASYEKVERVIPRTWYLALNLNPSDGHTMGYVNGWTEDRFIGTYAEALTKDYLNRMVWNQPVQYIAIARHQAGEVDAVKVFRFREGGRSLLDRFRELDPGREVVTEGGPLQEEAAATAQNLHNDPVFSVAGDLAFNWRYTDNGHRIVLTGGHLSAEDSNDDETRGIGNDIACNPITEVSSNRLAIDFLNTDGSVQGTEGMSKYPNWSRTPAYGNYAIYVSEDASYFPHPGTKLALEVEVEGGLRFFN